MNNQHYIGGLPNIGPNNKQMNSVQNITGTIGYQSFTKGNVCAYTPSSPVQYNQLQITHWPSQDYLIPHPKGFAHTLHTKQNLNQHVPYRDFYQAPDYVIQQAQRY